MEYSKFSDINAVLARLGGAPLAIADMDGCILLGYDALGDHKITPNMSADKLESGILKGEFQRTIFAANAMDVRLSPDMVTHLNRWGRLNRCPAPVAFLTSRPLEAALEIMRRSGLSEDAIENTIIVADSGANITFGGVIESIRNLSDEERKFFAHLDDHSLSLAQTAVSGVLEEANLDTNLTKAMGLEIKGIARNIHYRKILELVGEEEGSALDQKIRTAIQGTLQNLVNEKADEPDKYKVHFGPATVETILTGTDKASGLAAILTKYQDIAGGMPTGILGAGDDLHGTDQPFARALATIKDTNGIPTAFFHVHHPVGNDYNSLSPDPKKAAETVPGEPLQIAARVRNPFIMSTVILHAIENPPGSGIQPRPKAS